MAASDSFLVRAIHFIRKHSQDTVDAVRWDDDDLVQLVETANADIWDEILSSNEPNTLVRFLEADVTISDGVEDYPYPANFRRFVSLVKKDDDGDREKEIIPVSYQGLASGCVLMDDRFRIQPIPNIVSDETWKFAYVAGVPKFLCTGLVSAGAASSVTLSTATTGSLSAELDFYVGARINMLTGTSAGQIRTITGYTTGKVATVDSNWTTNPVNADTYEILPCVDQPLDRVMMWRAVMEIRASDADVVALNSANAMYKRLMRQILLRSADRQQRFGKHFAQDGTDRSLAESHVFTSDLWRL